MEDPPGSHVIALGQPSLTMMGEQNAPPHFNGRVWLLPGLVAILEKGRPGRLSLGLPKGGYGCSDRRQWIFH